LAPAYFASKPSTGEDSAMSSDLPCGMPSHDVEHHDIAEFFQADEMSECTADLA